MLTLSCMMCIVYRFRLFSFLFHDLTPGSSRGKGDASSVLRSAAAYRIVGN